MLGERGAGRWGKDSHSAREAGAVDTSGLPKTLASPPQPWSVCKEWCVCGGGVAGGGDAGNSQGGLPGRGSWALEGEREV